MRNFMVQPATRAPTIQPRGQYQLPLNFSKTHSKADSDYRVPNFINNAFTSSAATKWIDVHDPATNFVVSRVPESTDEELKQAVKAAQNAFPSWRATGVLHRQQIMFKFVALIRQHWDRLAASITLEQGKTFADARGDVLHGLQVAETACGITTQLTGEVLEVSKDMERRSYREPLGVVASICPFSAALILAELAKEASFPEGVINIIHGTHNAVNFILDEPSIKAISFVGGNAAGEYIYSRGSANGKRVQANLGARNDAIVLADCHKQQTITSINGAAFGAAGQRCMVLSILVLTGKETHAWIDDIATAARELKVHRGFEEGADLGPVISPQSLQRIESLIASAEEEGAEVVLDGRGYRPDGYDRGNFLGPTIIKGVKPHMKCYQEEIFSPVLVCLEVDTLAEATNLVNDNIYGNGVAIFTKSGSSASWFQRNIEAGQVGINVPIPVPLPMFSFTGNKKSIAGRGVNTFYGKPGLNFYTQTKTVTSLWKASDDMAAKAAVVMPSQN
ncbi:Methylmalonate-semialdehyde dehydrogenase [acylating], mitochondrial [Tolypocladium ophioglossoides CBS 100239]|uniref:Methylmalonate-semialdehyde dehydrogenase [acylating], mitochondrial n=1 Tax=Tolypocladium ophioglossoides (strain CBS 100239) TaxID=1163406 RepID=A0A0L0N2I3_TOLOC|nr:Methylmalonate-semialdehyde dehydrogenase [acylating], mitochondrial [Tolypocladium ophioglossoides CBS 100239]